MGVSQKAEIADIELTESDMFSRPVHSSNTNEKIGTRFLATRTEFLKATRNNGLEALLYRPSRRASNRPPLVLVHGISRNAPALIHAFAPVAEKLGINLLAPIFPRLGQKNYQRPATRSANSEIAFLDLLGDVTQQCEVDFSRNDMFGFSGGAQFVHRFALLRPNRVRKLLMASSGWYTFPSLENRYPYGIGKKIGDAVDRRFDLDGFLELSIKVVVGELDVTRDPNLRVKGNMDHEQGPTRLARGANWVNAIGDMMRERKATGKVQFEILPNCGHSFDDCVTVGGLCRTAATWFG